MVDSYPRNADETTREANEHDGKVSNSNSEAAIDTYPANADETTTEPNEDDWKVSNSNSEVAVDTCPGNANETTTEVEVEVEFDIVFTTMNTPLG